MIHMKYQIVHYKCVHWIKSWNSIIKNPRWRHDHYFTGWRSKSEPWKKVYNDVISLAGKRLTCSALRVSNAKIALFFLKQKKKSKIFKNEMNFLVNHLVKRQFEHLLHNLCSIPSFCWNSITQWLSAGNTAVPGKRFGSWQRTSNAGWEHSHSSSINKETSLIGPEHLREAVGLSRDHVMQLLHCIK